MIFDQGMNTTTLRVTWSGVPVGDEDITRRNFRDYYVNNIKYYPVFNVAIGTRLNQRSHFTARRPWMWSMEKACVVVVLGAALIAVFRLTFGYGLVL
jgi:hypothetical protein